MPTAMKVSTLLRVLPELPVTTSVLLRGPHGIGKSTIVRDVSALLSEREGRVRHLVDRRLSTMQAGDLMGLPSIESRSTRWNPPDWFKLCCDEPCDLHLDEFNRAELELLQSSFQIILDRELNGFKLHPDTRVYASINIGSGYNVQPIDPALLARFWVADVVLTKEEWIAWARANGVHPEVVDWIDLNERFLLPVTGQHDPSEKGTDPRSIVRMASALRGLLDPSPSGSVDASAIMPIAMGYVGVEATASLVAHLNAECRWSGRNVLESWSSIRGRTKLHRVDVMRNLLDKVVDELKGHSTMGVPIDPNGDAPWAPVEQLGANVESFLWDCPSDLRPLFFQLLARLGIERLDLIKSVHPYFVAPIVTGTYGVPVGKAGIGVMPRAGAIGEVAAAESAQSAAE